MYDNIVRECRIGMVFFFCCCWHYNSLWVCSSALVRTRLFHLRKDISRSSCLISLSHLTTHFSIYFFGHSLDLFHVGFNSITFLFLFFLVFFILLRFHHHFIICVLVCLTIPSPLINFSYSSLFLILHPSSVSSWLYIT